MTSPTRTAHIRPVITCGHDGSDGAGDQDLAIFGWIKNSILECLILSALVISAPAPFQLPEQLAGLALSAQTPTPQSSLPNDPTIV